jgi:hypothetical protein
MAVIDDFAPDAPGFTTTVTLTPKPGETVTDRLRAASSVGKDDKRGSYSLNYRKEHFKFTR